VLFPLIAFVLLCLPLHPAVQTLLAKLGLRVAMPGMTVGTAHVIPEARVVLRDVRVPMPESLPGTVRVARAAASVDSAEAEGFELDIDVPTGGSGGERFPIVARLPERVVVEMIALEVRLAGYVIEGRGMAFLATRTAGDRDLHFLVRDAKVSKPGADEPLAAIARLTGVVRVEENGTRLRVSTKPRTRLCASGIRGRGLDVARIDAATRFEETENPAAPRVRGDVHLRGFDLGKWTGTVTGPDMLCSGRLAGRLRFEIRGTEITDLRGGFETEGEGVLQLRRDALKTCVAGVLQGFPPEISSLAEFQRAVVAALMKLPYSRIEAESALSNNKLVLTVTVDGKPDTGMVKIKRHRMPTIELCPNNVGKLYKLYVYLMRRKQR
jgi:hypothetical protein